jgi:hypothetical protein
VADPIRIEPLDAGEAYDLAQALAVRGITARPMPEGDPELIEIRDPHEQTERLVADVTAAVEDWLADRRRRSIDVVVEGGARTPVAPAGLAESLGSEVVARASRRASA